MKISKFLGSQSPDKPFHSSGYAREAQGERIGSASHETFAQRQAAQRNRQIIGHYKDARINQNRSSDHTTRPSPYRARVNGADQQNTATRNDQINPTGNRQPNAPATQRSAFREPQSRKYDPFA